MGVVVHRMMYTLQYEISGPYRQTQGIGLVADPQYGPHEKWNNGKESKAVPRHKEINEFTALGIIRFAGKNPPERKEKK